MTCLAYADPRLVAVYDTLNSGEAHYDYYLALAGNVPCTVLDMGCGTGRLAVEMARRGHRATGADPAGAMLEVARARPGGEAVTWVLSDAAGLALEQRFDLAFMTGHVFQVFLDDEAVVAALSAMRRHLAPGGRVTFETRNPAVREWETWIPDETTEHLVVPGLGPVTVHYDIARVEGELVTFETHFRFGDEAPAVATTTLRFMGRETLERQMEAAGLTAEAWYGDWDRSPVRKDAPEIIVIARG